MGKPGASTAQIEYIKILEKKLGKKPDEFLNYLDVFEATDRIKALKAELYS